LKAITLAIAVLALAPKGAPAFELCEPGKSEAFYLSIKPLEDLAKDKKFEELDRQMNAMLAAYDAGKMSDQLVHRALLRYYSAHVGWDPLLREWMAKYPRSRAARIALGYHLTARGWGARGSEYANKTSREQFEEAERYFRQALKVFDEADSLGGKPTLSIAQRIGISRTAPALGLDAERLYRDAIKAYPDTLQVRIRYLEMSEPKWGGSFRQMESVIDDAKGMSRSDRSYIEYLVYQRMASAYWCAEGGCGSASGSRTSGEFAKQVIGYYEKSIPLCPGLDASLAYLMRYHEGRRDYPALVASASRMIERFPRDAKALYMRGEGYSNLGRYKEAFADISRAAELGDAYSHKELAWFYETGTAVPKDVRKAIDLYLIADRGQIEGARAEAERLAKASGIPLK
jgi:tetratricopeptide (TPR) repeat protein